MPHPMWIFANTVCCCRQATQRARARWETGQKVAMEKAAAEAVEDREKALEDARRVRKIEALSSIQYYYCMLLFLSAAGVQCPSRSDEMMESDRL